MPGTFEWQFAIFLPVESPGGAEPLGETGGCGGGDAGGGLGGPVVVGGVARVEGVVGGGGEGLRRHQAVELGAEAARRRRADLAEVARRLDEVALPLPPLGPAVLEPDLREEGQNKFSIVICNASLVSFSFPVNSFDVDGVGDKTALSPLKWLLTSLIALPQ